MKARIAKILLPVIILAALVAALGIIVSAEDAKTPEIISQNVQYSEYFSLMYAVDASTVNEGPVTLNLYYADPASGAEIARTYTAAEPQNEKIDGVETSVYVFVTEGVAAKNFDKCFYVQAVDNTGAESKVVRYSVLEYMLVRLYGGQTITEGQRGLYENAIDFAAFSQRVLINEADEDTANDIPLANSYSLVKIEGGVIGEAEGATNGYSQGVYTEGAVIYPYSKGAPALKLRETDSEGNVTERKIANGAAVTVSANTVITPTTPDPGEYFDTYGGLNFEGYNNIKEAETAGKLNRPSYNVKDPATLPYTGTEDYIALTNEGGNKNMVLTTQAATTKPGIYVMDTQGASGNCYVFEASFKLDIESASALTVAEKAAPRIAFFLVGDATLNYGSPTGNEANAGLTGSGFAAIYVVKDSEGNPHYYLNHNNSKTANNDIITANNEITAGWHTITCEIYENGWVKVYLDGNYVDEAKCISNTDLGGEASFKYANTDSVRIKYAASSSQGYVNNSSIYLDDIFFGKVTKAYVAE